MKRLIALIVMVFSILMCSNAYAKDVYRFDRIGKYEVCSERGKTNIEPGTYTVTARQDNNFVSRVSIGDNLNQYGDPLYKDEYYICFSLVHPDNSALDKSDTYKSYTVTLEEGQDVYIHTDSVIFTRADPDSSELNSPNAVASAYTSSDNENKLSSEEIAKIVNSAPYVSSKNISITSPEGVDFYAYFGSGIIMSNVYGDCFKMEKLEDENIVDHYKLIPNKVGKGRIEYVINMNKKITVNVTVEKSALN